MARDSAHRTRSENRRWNSKPIPAGGVRAHRGEEGSDKDAEAAKRSAGATGGSHEKEKRQMREGRETGIETRRLGRLL